MSQADDGAQAEDVQDQRLEDQVKPALHDGDAQVRVDEHHRRADEEQDEAPRNQDVEQPRPAVARPQLLLADGVAEKPVQPLPPVVGAFDGLPRAPAAHVVPGARTQTPAPPGRT